LSTFVEKDDFLKELPVRKGVRLKGHDYASAGYYFVTFCVKDKHELLGEIKADVGAIINRPPPPTIRLSEYGQVVQAAIQEIPVHYTGVVVDKYVIMPNHIHMILMLGHGRLIIAPTKTSATVSTIIKQLKRQASKQVGFSLWQKSFHDRIIRDEADYHRACQYIADNPAKWTEDEYYA